MARYDGLQFGLRGGAEAAGTEDSFKDSRARGFNSVVPASGVYCVVQCSVVCRYGGGYWRATGSSCGTTGRTTQLY